MRRIALTGIVIGLLVLSGCGRRQIVLPAPHHPAVEKKPIDWAKETNIPTQESKETIQTETKEKPLVQAYGETQTIKRVPFNEKEYYPYTAVGKGIVKGEVYLIAYGDRKIKGANRRLYLNPKTSYSKQWYIQSYLGGKKLDKPDSRLFNYLRFTTSDEEGRFAFYGVPKGSYYLVGTIECGYECGFDIPKQIRLATEVEVKEAGVTNKDLTKIMGI